VSQAKSTSTLLAPIAPGNVCPFLRFRFENAASLSIALPIWRSLTPMMSIRVRQERPFRSLHKPATASEVYPIVKTKISPA